MISEMLNLIGKKVVDIQQLEIPDTHFRIEFEDGYILRIPKINGIELLKRYQKENIWIMSLHH